MDNFLIYFIISFVISITSALTLEERDAEIWARSEYENDTSVRPCNITWPEHKIADLKYRLNNTSEVNPPLEGDVGFTYGFNTKSLVSWLKYWTETYNFTERLALMNQHSQYKTNIQGIDIFFIWEKPEVNSSCTVFPLLLLHGFPGSIVEFYKAIPMLTTCVDGVAFQVIVPCLPGYGYSAAATRPGLGAAAMATVLKNFMLRLGFVQWYLQGGDFGSEIGSMMCTLYPTMILGFHTNFAIPFSELSIGAWIAGSLNTSLVVQESLKSRMYPITTIFANTLSATGYFHMQATKPDTLGIAMSDSPAALLAYILTLFSGSRSKYIYEEDGGLDDGLYTRDELIDNLMFYWMPNKFTTAARLYAESFNKKAFSDGLHSMPTSVPTWTLHALYEMIFFSRPILKFKFPVLINSTVLDDYGHFFALEQPKLYAENVRLAITAFEAYHKQRSCIATDL